jgi:hypothetical protein
MHSCNIVADVTYGKVVFWKKINPSDYVLKATDIQMGAQGIFRCTQGIEYPIYEILYSNIIPDAFYRFELRTMSWLSNNPNW